MTKRRSLSKNLVHADAQQAKAKRPDLVERVRARMRSHKAQTAQDLLPDTDHQQIADEPRLVHTIYDSSGEDDINPSDPVTYQEAKRRLYLHKRKYIQSRLDSLKDCPAFTRTLKGKEQCAWYEKLLARLDASQTHRDRSTTWITVEEYEDLERAFEILDARKRLYMIPRDLTYYPRSPDQNRLLGQLIDRELAPRIRDAALAKLKIHGQQQPSGEFGQVLKCEEEGLLLQHHRAQKDGRWIDSIDFWSPNDNSNVCTIEWSDSGPVYVINFNPYSWNSKILLFVPSIFDPHAWDNSYPYVE